MQQMLLISLSAQVEFLVQSMSRMNVEVVNRFDDQKKHMEKIDENFENLDHKVVDLGVAIAKTSRFDTHGTISHTGMIQIAHELSRV